jgi:hypothetical protein
LVLPVSPVDASTVTLCAAARAYRLSKVPITCSPSGVKRVFSVAPQLWEMIWPR